MLRKKLLTKNKINQPAQTFLLSLSKLFSDLNLICFTKASKNSMTCENKQNTSSEMLWLGLNQPCLFDPGLCSASDNALLQSSSSAGLILVLLSQVKTNHIFSSVVLSQTFNRKKTLNIQFTFHQRWCWFLCADFPVCVMLPGLTVSPVVLAALCKGSRPCWEAKAHGC